MEKVSKQPTHEIKMTSKEILQEIEYEGKMGINTLLQNIFSLNSEKDIDLEHMDIDIFKVLNAENKLIDYRIRDKQGKDVQL